jgi:4-amino-4-deoxy-L-arabinose transferase-like glycosyltransferase
MVSATAKKEDMTSDATVEVWIRVILLLLVSAIVIFIGQAGRELTTPDDLREVEVAREMYTGGDYIVPHLAGLPFVEKPSGFPAVIATVYRIVGSPSAPAARFTAAAFALSSLMALFFLGRNILGGEGGAIATALLAFSQRFCRTAHEVLLDNALTAAIAFTVLFTWFALEANTPLKKHLAYAAAGFILGISFLFKGFVGPIIFGSGFLFYLILSRRFSELRHISHPLPVIAFLLPVLTWIIPFLLYAQSHLIREFFINNQLGRFLFGYDSHKRPFYFYHIHLWSEFSPGAILLPLAGWTAWKTRKEWENRAGIFFLSFSVGSLILLSVSAAKDEAYFLPVHPALAMLIAWSIVKGWGSPGHGVRILARVLAVTVCLAAGAMVTMTAIFGGSVLSVTTATVVFVVATTGCLLSIRHNNLHWTSACIAVLIALGWSLWFTGPMAKKDLAGRIMPRSMTEALSLVGNRDILLYRPNDGLRGAASFYRNRTAQEISSPAALVARLAENSHKAVALLYSNDKEALPPELVKAARISGVHFQIKAHFDFDYKYLLLISSG